jgi:electron transfer flavoprotein alpha subunit
MSNYIVLVKQVPDVSQITDNAFDPETGTLIRSRLASVINELDCQALAFANRMKQISGDQQAKIIALTMGPPMAAEVLRYSLSRCADAAVLLTDKKLGGADTWATANPLAFAIRKIIAEILDGDQDYFIVSGMQSVDGDTAQVPGQIAQELDISCVSYATDVKYDNGRFEFERIISGGCQTVSPKATPAIITVAKYEYPLFATFAATRKANKIDLIQWGADDINATGIGVAGSKTRVIRVFPPGKTTRKCCKITDVKDFAAKIFESHHGQSLASAQMQQQQKYVLPTKRKPFDRTFEGTAKESEDFKLLGDILLELGIEDVSKITDEKKALIISKADNRFHAKALEDMLAGFMVSQPSYQGQVWVMAEHDGPAMHPATFELLGKARELADSLETKVGVVIIGDKVEHFSKTLIAAGADIVYLTEHPLLKEFDPKSCRKAVAGIVEKYWPQIMLYSATPTGRILAPMVSYKLNCGLTADCTSLDIKDSSRKQQIAILMQTRPALGGNVMATISTKDSKCQMATTRPGVLKRLPEDPSRAGTIIKCPVDIAENDLSLNILKTDHAGSSVNLSAEVIVSGGKGMQSRDNYEQLLGGLISAMRNKLGTDVERGASRAAVEQGFIDRAHQVGQTGTSVGPKIYVALGISGAIQHMIGVANTETIFAINSDPEAPIFRQCDYYMAANVEDVIPQLVEELNKA